MPPARSLLRWALAVGAVLLLASACSNRESSVNRQPHTGATTAAAGAGTQVVRVVAEGFRFDPSQITVHPGLVRIELHNVAKGGVGPPHNWAVPTKSVTTPLVPAGRFDSVTFTAPAPGHYTFVCTIHAKQGQTGTLVVLDR